jgi:hypothetical protein
VEFCIFVVIGFEFFIYLSFHCFSLDSELVKIMWYWYLGFFLSVTFKSFLVGVEKNGREGLQFA